MSNIQVNLRSYTPAWRNESGHLSKHRHSHKPAANQRDLELLFIWTIYADTTHILHKGGLGVNLHLWGDSYLRISTLYPASCSGCSVVAGCLAIQKNTPSSYLPWVSPLRKKGSFQHTGVQRRVFCFPGLCPWGEVLVRPKMMPRWSLGSQLVSSGCDWTLSMFILFCETFPLNLKPTDSPTFLPSFRLLVLLC